MRKIVILSVATLLVACNANTSSPKNDQTADTSKVENVTPPSDVHNAKNSLDYKGTYKGTLPTASGSGMEVTVVLADSTYTKEVKYVDKKDKAISTKGSYTWNEQGTTITLVGEDKPNQYFVEENALRHLDMEGNKITGDMEAMYILKK
ncbi:MAG: hypothetical protein RL662_2215 [Bacteroidota bacterium]|jgi:uncharacterized lipoprotein NlpE involved in copper resistance